MRAAGQQEQQGADVEEGHRILVEQADADHRTRMFRLGLALAAAAGFFALLIVILRYGFGVHLW